MNFNNSVSSSVKILVVDDYPNTAALLARSISQLGAGVDAVSATSGIQALEWCVQDGPIDIVITDMDMPDMTGLELIEKLQEHSTRSPIVSLLITASHAPELEARARHLQVRNILHKPVPPERVSQIISQVLEEMNRELT